ncbi:MAG: site-specific integrase [Acidobacteria bacterium]|nr:site-specific integrase [Acidobacteriota bacterium]
MVRRNSYQKGCLFKRGRNWVARWREKVIEPDGSLGTRQPSVVLGTIAELSKSKAQNLLNAKLQPLNQGRQRPQTTLTLEQFVRDHWEPAVKPFIRETTLAAYQLLLRSHILPRFGKARLTDISRADVQTFLAKKLSDGLSSNHVHTIKTTLGKVFSTAVQLEFLDRNPVRDLQLGARKNAKERVVFTKAQSELLLSALPEPCRTYAQFDLLTWLRPGEQFALRWKNADLDKGVIRVLETYVPKYKKFNPPKTQPSIRDIPMSAAVVELLSLYRERCEPVDSESLVFHNSVGSPVDWDKLNSKVIRPLCKQLGLPVITWHGFRHTGATLAADAGVPHRTIQALLGHGNSSTTDLYVHRVLESEQQAMDKMGEMFPSVPKLLETETGKMVN